VQETIQAAVAAVLRRNLPPAPVPTPSKRQLRRKPPQKTIIRRQTARNLTYLALKGLLYPVPNETGNLTVALSTRHLEPGPNGPRFVSDPSPSGGV